MNQMNINKTNGLKFEERFLEELQSRFKTVKTSRSTNYMYICDIVHEDCLIELKSNRDAYKETTQQTFQKICKVGLKSFKATGIKKGLFFQTIELLKYDRSMTIVGNYQIEPNKLHNLFIKNPDQAWFNYHEYKIHTHWSHGSSYTRMPAIEFWRLADESSSLVHLKKNVEGYACDHGGYNNDLDISNHYSGDEHDSAFYWLEITKGFQEPIIKNFLPKGESDQWGNPSNELWGQNIIDTQQLEIPLDQATQNWIEKEKQAQESIEAEQNKTTQEPVENIIDQITVFSKEELLMIRESIKKHDSLSNISKRLGKHRSHLQKIINAKESNNHAWKGLEWDVFRSWIIPILQEFDHTQVPLWICSNEEKDKIIISLQQSNNNYQKMKTANEKIKQELKVTQAKIKELEVTNKNSNDAWFDLREKCIKLGSENQDLKNQIDNQEKNEMDEATTLKLEAYQAEIKKLQAENEEYKETNEGLETESENLKTCIDKLNLEVERLTDVLELEEEQKSSLKDALHEHFEKFKARDERVIDGLLDLIDEQKLTIDSYRKSKKC